MSKCAVKRGIITLRDCGMDAVDTCVACSRSVCQEHLKIRSGETLCVECYARREEEAIKAASTKSPSREEKSRSTSKTTDDDWRDSSWPYIYRHDYYTTSYYHPFYTGSYYDSYYDNYDVRSFDATTEDMIPDEDPGAGGFYDS